MPLPRPKVDKTPKENANAFDGLTEKQKKFVVNYLQHFNASKAARDAGYTNTSHGNNGNRLLASDKIQLGMHAYLKKSLSADGVMPLDELLGLLTKSARANLTNVLDWKSGNLSVLDKEKWSDNEKDALTEFSEGKFGKKVKMINQIKARELLLKYYMFLERLKKETKVEDEDTGKHIDDLHARLDALE